MIGPGFANLHGMKHIFCLLIGLCLTLAAHAAPLTADAVILSGVPASQLSLSILDHSDRLDLKVTSPSGETTFFSKGFGFYGYSYSAGELSERIESLYKQALTISASGCPSVDLIVHEVASLKKLSKSPLKNLEVVPNASCAKK